MFLNEISLTKILLSIFPVNFLLFLSEVTPWLCVHNSLVQGYFTPGEELAPEKALHFLRDF